MPTAARPDLAPPSAKWTPGPGAYEAAAPLGPTHFAQSAAFASQSGRFSQGPPVAVAPGPGALGAAVATWRVADMRCRQERTKGMAALCGAATMSRSTTRFCSSVYRGKTV
jgi:hypothetical protein